MNPFLCNTCGFGLCATCGGCGHCHSCSCKKDCCEKPCGCPESILSIEAESTNPTNLRFNLGGRSVWHDFDSVVKAGETDTSLSVDLNARNLVYNAERHTNTISASTLGGMLHLADIGDVDATTIKDNAILVYKKDADCSENCDGKNGWIGLDPSEAGDSSLDYIMGSDADGEVKSLMPPANSSQFYYMTWAGQNKASWKQPTVAASAPTDSDGKVWRLYVDPNTHELLIVRENP